MWASTGGGVLAADNLETQLESARFDDESIMRLLDRFGRLQ